jgi:hypothetical protein
MGIVKWWNDKWNKPTEAAQEPLRVPPESILNDIDRLKGYVAHGGEVVDLSNKPRMKNDGFAPDHELMTPFNEAHRGMKEGLMRGGRG